MPAFVAALRAGADGVSIDVSTTLDGELLCFCDRADVRARLLEQAEPPLRERDLEALRDVVLRQEVAEPGGVRVYAGPEPIPRLVDALALLPRDALVILHLPDPALAPLPSPASYRVAGRVADLVERLGLLDRAIVCSSDPLALHRARRATHGRVRTAFVWSDPAALVSSWLGRAAAEATEAAGRLGKVLDRVKASGAARRLLGSAEAAVVEFTALDHRLVAELRAQGAHVGTFTVFARELGPLSHGLDPTLQARILERLVHAGLDWVETDDPGLARTIVERGWTAMMVPA